MVNIDLSNLNNENIYIGDLYICNNEFKLSKKGYIIDFFDNFNLISIDVILYKVGDNKYINLSKIKNKKELKKVEYLLNNNIDKLIIDSNINNIRVGNILVKNLKSYIGLKNEKLDIKELKLNKKD